MANETGTVPSMEEVADRMAITEVLAQHSRGVDRADGEILRSAYWPDASVAYGGFHGEASEFCAMLPQAIRAFARTQHVLGNISIDLRGSDARVETYVTAWHYTAAENGPDREMTYLGRYLDRMEKRGNVWKIHHRQVVMDWNRNNPATAIWQGPSFEGLTRGCRAPEDPLYAHLG